MSSPVRRPLNLSLPPQLVAEAKCKATQRGLSLSEVVRLLLAAYVAGEVVVNPAIVGAAAEAGERR